MNLSILMSLLQKIGSKGGSGWSVYLCLPFVMCCYQYGNFKGTEHFLWQIPSEPSCRSDTSNARVISRINEHMAKYATRAMKKEFIDKYSQ